MASSSNKDNTMEYDKQIHKKTNKTKNHLAGRLNKFQETINQTQTPHTPAIVSIHEQQDVPSNVMNEIKQLYQLIKDHGQQGDYAIQITFGELIPIFGNAQVDKLVEILSAARKHGYINYLSNDSLQQERDEDIFIKLIKTPY